MSDGPYRHLRIAFVGSCQVTGLAAAARVLLPGVQTSAWHLGVHPPDSEAEIRALLPGYDLTVTQVPDWEPHESLRIGRLKESGLPAVLLPVVSFSGFHPDIIFVRRKDGSFLRGFDGDYHSLIVASAFNLGVPEHRVPGLFNPYIFAVLGYYEVFAASKAALIESFGHQGYELEPFFELWMRLAQPFMYTINHPHITVMSSLCATVLTRAGLVDAGAGLPEGVEDALASHFVWPVYPALARRIGVPGSTTFLRRAHAVQEGQKREVELAEYVAASYRIYGNVNWDELARGEIATASERLKESVVV